MGEWTAISEVGQTDGLTVVAYWEGDPAAITRVSVSGDCSVAEAEAAVRRALRACGSTSEPRIEWDVGEAYDERVAVLRA